MVEEAGSTTVEVPVLLFDGVCNLCNTTVDSLMRMDRGRDPVRLKFASLQSAQAKSALESKGLKPEMFVGMSDARDETVVLLTTSGRVSSPVFLLPAIEICVSTGCVHSQVHVRSGAILLATAQVAPLWLAAVCYMLMILPVFLRDFMYKQARWNPVEPYVSQVGMHAWLPTSTKSGKSTSHCVWLAGCLVPDPLIRRKEYLP